MAATINLRQLGIAIRKESERKNRKGEPVNKQLVFTLAYRVAKLYWDEELDCEFEDALRTALNELHILKELGRDSYRWIMGSYFGTHGNRKKARNKAGGKTGGKSAKMKTEEKTDKPLDVFEEKDGSHQLALKV